MFFWFTKNRNKIRPKTLCAEREYVIEFWMLSSAEVYPRFGDF